MVWFIRISELIVGKILAFNSKKGSLHFRIYRILFENSKLTMQSVFLAIHNFDCPKHIVNIATIQKEGDCLLKFILYSLRVVGGLGPLFTYYIVIL